VGLRHAVASIGLNLTFAGNRLILPKLVSD